MAHLYLRDPLAAEAGVRYHWIPESGPDPLDKMFGDRAQWAPLKLSDLDIKCAMAEKYAAGSQITTWRKFTADLTPAQIAAFETQERSLLDQGWSQDDVIDLYEGARQAAENTRQSLRRSGWDTARHE